MHVATLQTKQDHYNTFLGLLPALANRLMSLGSLSVLTNCSISLGSLSDC